MSLFDYHNSVYQDEPAKVGIEDCIAYMRPRDFQIIDNEDRFENL